MKPLTLFYQGYQGEGWKRVWGGALLDREVDVVEDHAGLRERFRQRALREAVPL